MVGEKNNCIIMESGGCPVPGSRGAYGIRSNCTEKAVHYDRDKPVVHLQVWGKAIHKLVK